MGMQLALEEIAKDKQTNKYLQILDLYKIVWKYE